MRLRRIRHLTVHITSIKKPYLTVDKLTIEIEFSEFVLVCSVRNISPQTTAKLIYRLRPSTRSTDLSGVWRAVMCISTFYYGQRSEHFYRPAKKRDGFPRGNSHHCCKTNTAFSGVLFGILKVYIPTGTELGISLKY